jgi:hypothetical protein
VLALLGLRRITAVGNGHCCVYSVAHQLDFQNADPSMLAFNISDADCLGLRQKAYDLLTTPSDFLTGCLAPFEGNTSPCCGIAGCRAFSIRLKCAKNTERSPDGKPVEWTEGVLKPLLKMGSSPGYVGDHFLRATAILFRRDIVVLSEPGGRGSAPGAKIFYANSTWFTTKATRCLTNPTIIRSCIYGTVTDWDAFVAWYETGKPLPRKDDARICPPRTYSGHPIVITHNGVSGGGAHYNSTAPLVAASPPGSPSVLYSPVPTSPSEAAVSVGPPNRFCMDNRACDGMAHQTVAAAPAAAAPAAQPPPHARNTTCRRTASRAPSDSNLSVYRRSSRLAASTSAAAGATAAVAAPASRPVGDASTPPSSVPALPPAQQTPQIPVMVSQPEVLLPRVPHDTWIAIRDGGVAAANGAASKANASIATIIAAATGACSKGLPGNGLFSGFPCCFCAKKCKSVPALKCHMKLKPKCNQILTKILADARPTTPAVPAPVAATVAAAPVTRAATRPAMALERAGDASLDTAWNWACALDSSTLPSLDMIQCVRRIPRSIQQDFDLMASMVLSRLRADKLDVAAHNILFLMPRLILRRDPAKGDTTHNGRAERDALLRDHALAMPAGDCLKMRMERFKNGDWQNLYDDYERAAAVQRQHRASKPAGNVSAAALRLSAFKKADRLVGCNELSRGANAVISTSQAENDASFAASSLAAKHPVSGGLTEDVASAIDVALSESSDALQIDEESFAWALAHHSRGAAAGPSGWTLECWKDLCADANISASLLAFVNATFCRAKLPPALMHLWGSCNTVGLTKKDGGLRPISMGETLRRLTGKAAAHQLRDTTSAHLQPLQWGVNTSRGCATIAHTARDYLRRHPDHVLLKLDIANAFNSQSRGAFLTTVATAFPELLPLAAQFYLLPTTLYIRGKEGTCTLQSVSGQQQGDTLGPLLFALGLQPAIQAVQDKYPGVIVRAYIDDIHLIGPDSDVAAAFGLLRKLLSAQNLQVSFGASKTSAWSPAWETNPSRTVTSAVLGPLHETTERIHQCSGGIKTLGTFIGTDTFVRAASMALICSHDFTCASPEASENGSAPTEEPTRVEDDFQHACNSVAVFAHHKAASSVHSANVLLQRCIVPKIGYSLELLPPHLVADSAAAAHKLVVQAYCDINDITAEEAAGAFHRLALPPSLAGCGLRYYPDVSPAAYTTSRLHTAPAVTLAINTAEAAQAAIAAEGAGADSSSSSSFGELAPVRRGQHGRDARAATPPAAAAPPPPPATTPLQDVTTDLAAALALLPDAARAEIDTSVIGSAADLKDYVHLQRKLTRHIEEERASRVLDSAKAAVTAEVPGSEPYTHALRNLAHLKACDGTWLLAPALAHMRMTASHYRIRVRRFLRLPLPVCNYADGIGSNRPPRSASNVAHPTHDMYGDFTLSDFRAVGQAQWLELHEEIKHFFFRAAKQAGVTSVTTEKRADLATSRRRPGDVKIGSTRHGWKAATGKTLLIDFTTISSVCATWAALSAATTGGGGKGAAAEKTRVVLNSGELSENQHFLALGFESEGYVPEEAKKLLYAWAKLYKEDKDLTNGDMSLMLFKWTTELAFIRSKFLAKCILERAAFSAEKQDNIDGITHEVRRPLPHQLHVFAAH